MFISEENLRKLPAESNMFAYLAYCINGEETQNYPMELINLLTTSNILLQRLNLKIAAGYYCSISELPKN